MTEARDHDRPAESDRRESWRRGAPFVVAVAALLILPGWMLARDVRLGSRDPPPASRAPRLRIDLNRADAHELELLPGIGPKLAERIVRDRRERGEFRTVEELDRVPGVGPRTVRRLAPLVIAGPSEAP